MPQNVKKKSASHIYWGIQKNTGALMHISMVPSGLKCDCICVACREPLEARKGEIRKHHFAHVSNYECMYASEVAVYKALADTIEHEGKVSLPSVFLKFHSYRKPELLQESRTVTVGEVSFECQPLSYPPLLIVHAAGHKLRILIDFGHYYDQYDFEQFAQEGADNEYSILLYKMPRIDDDSYFTPKHLQELLKSNDIADWVFSRLEQRWKARYLANARSPVEHGDGYLCPISVGKHQGKYSARWIDCAHCNFNVGTPPGCKCLADVGIQRKEDFTRPIEERLTEISELRQQNEAKLEQEEKKSLVETAKYVFPKLVQDKPSQADLEVAYKRIVETFDPSSKEWTVDQYGRRWIKCKSCGEIKQDTQMSVYGGPDGANQGICSACMRQNRE